ncbi:MAG: GNAT family N-acetyltransferase [Bacillota bacterium]
MPEYKISRRRGTPGDYAILKNMEKLCFSECDRFSASSLRRFLLNPCGTITVDIIQANGIPAGYAVFFARKNSRVIRLYSFCVIPDFAGKGIGQGYLRKRLASFNEAVISLEVRASNARAQAVYKKLGFTISENLPGYYDDGEDGYRMVRQP